MIDPPPDLSGLDASLAEAMRRLIEARAQRQTQGPDVPPSMVAPESWGEGQVAVVEGQVDATTMRPAMAIASALPGWLPCDPCGDTGYTIEVKGGTEYTSAVRCARCAGLRDRVDAFNMAQLPAAAAGCGKDDFDWGRIHGRSFMTCREGMGSMRKSVRAGMREWMESWGSGTVGGRGLLLTGPTGTGKTHMALRAARVLTLRDAVPVRWTSWPAHLAAVKSTWDHGAGLRHADILRPLVTCDVLFIDEAGAGGGGEWAEGEFLRLLEARKGKPLVVTTNLQLMVPMTSPMSLEAKAGQRVVSRLLDLCDVVTFVADDYRASWYAKPEGGKS